MIQLFHGRAQVLQSEHLFGFEQPHRHHVGPRFAAIYGYTENDLETGFAPELEGLDRHWYNGYSHLGLPVRRIGMAFNEQARNISAFEVDAPDAAYFEPTADNLKHRRHRHRVG